MENNYDVGIANRFALFLEEGENSLTAIRKKINKETRIKDKLTKKESSDTSKVEPVNTQEKPKKSAESKPATNDATVLKKGNYKFHMHYLYVCTSHWVVSQLWNEKIDTFCSFASFPTLRRLYSCLLGFISNSLICLCLIEAKDKKNEAAKGKDKKFNDNAKRYS